MNLTVSVIFTSKKIFELSIAQKNTKKDIKLYNFRESTIKSSKNYVLKCNLQQAVAAKTALCIIL